MNARAAYDEEDARFRFSFLTEKGPTGSDLGRPTSLTHYDDTLSRQLTDHRSRQRCHAGNGLQAVPALSSGAPVGSRDLRGEWGLQLSEMGRMASLGVRTGSRKWAFEVEIDFPQATV